MGTFVNKHQDQDGRGLSSDLWKNFPAFEALVAKDANAGIGFFPDMAVAGPYCPVNQTTPIYRDGWTMYTDSAEYIRPTLASEYAGPGATRFFATTDNQECWAQGCNGGEPFCISDSAPRDLIFEACIRFKLITDSKSGWFIGLGEAGMAVENTIADAGTMVDKDFIGFMRLEGDGDKLDFVYNKAGAGGMTTKKADWLTLVADTWYHIGFRFSNGIIVPYYGTGVRTTTKMTPDYTNAITAANIAAATFPDGEYLAPLLGGKNAHADDAYMDCRLLAVAQTAKTAD